MTVLGRRKAKCVVLGDTGSILGTLREHFGTLGQVWPQGSQVWPQGRGGGRDPHGGAWVKITPGAIAQLYVYIHTCRHRYDPSRRLKHVFGMEAHIYSPSHKNKGFSVEAY